MVRETAAPRQRYFTSEIASSTNREGSAIVRSLAARPYAPKARATWYTITAST